MLDDVHEQRHVREVVERLHRSIPRTRSFRKPIYCSIPAIARSLAPDAIERTP
jgi:hypothetical protein